MKVTSLRPPRYDTRDTEDDRYASTARRSPVQAQASSNFPGSSQGPSYDLNYGLPFARPHSDGSRDTEHDRYDFPRRGESPVYARAPSQDSSYNPSYGLNYDSTPNRRLQRRRGVLRLRENQEDDDSDHNLLVNYSDGEE